MHDLGSLKSLFFKKFLRKQIKNLQEDVKLIFGEVCQVLRRYLHRHGRYSGKTAGGSDPTPPQAVADYHLRTRLITAANPNFAITSRGIKKVTNKYWPYEKMSRSGGGPKRSPNEMLPRYCATHVLWAIWVVELDSDIIFKFNLTKGQGQVKLDQIAIFKIY